MIVNKHKLDSVFFSFKSLKKSSLDYFIIESLLVIFKQTGPRTHLKNYQRKDTAMQLGNTLSELSTMSLQVITA